MTFLESILGLSTLLFVILAVVGFYLALKYHGLWRTKQARAFTLGGSQVKGDMFQLLGTFASLQEYDQLMLLSTTSKQGSLDLLGLKNDTIDFIEIKKRGAALQGPEKRLRRLVEDKKVRYVVMDVELPDQFKMTEREQP